MHLAMGGKLAYGSERQHRADGAATLQVPVREAGGPEPATPYRAGGCGQECFQGLEPGTEYDVQVRAANSHGYGPPSSVVRMVCAAGRPDVPVRMRHANKTSSALAPQPPLHQRNEGRSTAIAGGHAGERS